MQIKHRAPDQQPTLKPSNWYILGAGAIGGLWLSRFLRQNMDVTLICRNEAKCQKLKAGLRVESEQGDTIYHPNTIIPAHIPAPCRHILITCKAHQTLQALQSIHHAIDHRSRLVLLQNGMGIAEQIRTRYPANPISIATTTEGAFRKNDCHIFHAGIGHTWFGPWDNNYSPCHELIKIANNESSSASWDDKIEQRLWQKLTINCALNGLTVIYNCRNGELLDNGPRQHHLHKLCQEIDRIMAYTRYQRGSSTYQQAVDIAKKTAANYSSMLQDFKSNKSLEVGYLNAYLIKIAQKHNIDHRQNSDLIDALNLCLLRRN